MINLYIYTDNKTKEVVAEIKSESILDADKEVKELLGVDVIKQPNIGCQIKFNVEGDSK